MTTILTDKIALDPALAIKCEECGAQSHWIGTSLNGDRFVVDGYDDSEEVMFDIYRCENPACYHVSADTENPIWLDEESSFKVVECDE